MYKMNTGPVRVRAIHVGLRHGRRVLQRKLVSVQLLLVGERVSLHRRVASSRSPSVAVHARTSTLRMRRCQQAAAGQRRILSSRVVLLHRWLALAPGLVLVVGVLLHVRRAQPLGLVDERPFLGVGKQFPLGTQTLADLGVVHLWVLLGHLAPLSSRPHHKRVHGPLYFVHGVYAGRARAFRSRLGHVSGAAVLRHDLAVRVRILLTRLGLKFVFHHAVHHCESLGVENYL